jgi:rod shape-determining protein MreC
MQTLFLLFYRYRAFLFFLILEGLCAWFIVKNNNYQGAMFFNSSNAFVGYVNTNANSIQEYFNLDVENRKLAVENAQLLMMLANSSLAEEKPLTADSTDIDSVIFLFNPAKVINNSTNRLNNYITINRGSKDGIYPEMGIIGPQGIVGKVKDVSANYATVYSILHTGLLTSVYHVASGNNCTLRWDGKDPMYSKLLYIPRHVSPVVGDTIMTSGFNTVYPVDLMVGVIEDVEIAENEAFYNIRVALSTDFNSLSFVYCIENRGKKEIEQLEALSIK